MNARSTVVFLMSLLLAFSIWLIHNLSLNYVDVVAVSVTAQSNIEGRSMFSINAPQVQARCRLSGFELLRLRGRRATVNIAPSDLHFAGGDAFLLHKDAMAKYFVDIFGASAQMETFLTDTALFRFREENYRRVPVEPVCRIDCRPQYMQASPLRLTPDSVTVYGEPSRIAGIDKIYTRSFVLENLGSDAAGKVRLRLPAGVRLSENTVLYNQEVVRFVELSSRKAVAVRGVPNGKRVTVYPADATVSLRCVFQVTKVPDGDFELYIDYSDFVVSPGGKCLPKVGKMPPGVLSYSISPEVFDCVEVLR